MLGRPKTSNNEMIMSFLHGVIKWPVKGFDVLKGLHICNTCIYAKYIELSVWIPSLFCVWGWGQVYTLLSTKWS